MRGRPISLLSPAKFAISKSISAAVWPCSMAARGKSLIGQQMLLFQLLRTLRCALQAELLSQAMLRLYCLLQPQSRSSEGDDKLRSTLYLR